ncbi:MAG: MBL fold metallo-hydrolase [Methanomassiliicoccaceae archaeon]|nr:MBL fold metallo-hydrolase [Methanomassiliicoccaceae archaeon]
MKAKVLSVYDEGALPETPMIGARGLAILVDVDGERTLFGTGRRGSYLMHNLDYMEVDVGTIDRVVISHMHIDHVGGLEAFLERREESIEVIVTPDAEHVKVVKLLGIPISRTGLRNIPEETAAKMNLRYESRWTQLSKNLFLTATPPDGVDENMLVLMTVNGPVMLCGCCHCGPVAAMELTETAVGRKVSGIVGGLHLVDKKKNELYAIAEMFKEKGVSSLYLNHCSGQIQKTRLRERLGLSAVGDFYVGTEIQFDV